MKLIIKNKFGITGRSSVTDENGKDVFIVKGSIGGNLVNTYKKIVCGLDKKPIYIVRNAISIGRYSANIYNAKKEKILSMKEKKLLGFDGYDIEGTKEKMEIVKSNKAGAFWDFVVGGKVVARRLNNDKMTLLDSFTIEVYDKDDAALITAMIIAADNLNDRHKRNNK